MQDSINVEDISSVEKKIFINVGSETVNQKFNDFFDSIKKEAQVPGFRKGKAPVNVLKKYFGDRAKGTISQMLISEFYQKLLKEQNLNPINNPTIEGSNNEGQNKQYAGYFNDDNSYSVELKIEVLPEIVPVGYKDIKLNIPSDIKEEDVYEQSLLRIREQYAERNQVTDRGIEEGDTVTMDFKGFVDGEPFAGGEAQGFTLDKVGEHKFLPEFESQLIGMKAGEEKRISIMFPEDYHADHLAGKEAEFDIKVHNVISTKLAEVDEDLALIMGHTSIDELLEDIKLNAHRSYKTTLIQIAHQQIGEALLDANELEVPKSLVQQEKTRIIQQYQNQNADMQGLKAALDAVESNLKKALLFEAVYKAEDDIEVSPSELNEYLEEQAAANNIEKDRLVSELYNTNQMEAFVGVLRARKVTEFIIDQSQKSEEEDE